jgi:hypothetical protein
VSIPFIPKPPTKEKWTWKDKLALAALIFLGICGLARIAHAQFKGTDQRPVSQRVFRIGGPEIKGSRLVGPVYQASMATNLMTNYGGL